MMIALLIIIVVLQLALIVSLNYTMYSLCKPKEIIKDSKKESNQELSTGVEYLTEAREARVIEAINEK